MTLDSDEIITVQQTPDAGLAEADDTQYSLLKIMTIWAIVSLPMLVLVFYVAPFIAPHSDIHPFLWIWYAGIAGMAWQFVVSMWILYQELDQFTWPAIKERIWLNKPSDPNTGKKSYKLFWWLIPSFIFILVFEMSPGATILIKSYFQSSRR